MAIMTRLARLLRADLNAMLDRLEAPELVLAQAVRDMEQAQATEGARLKRLEHEVARLKTLTGEFERRLEQDQAALEDCLATDQDDLARAVLRRRLEAERAIERLSRQLQDNERARALSRSRLAAQDSRLTDLRARAAVLNVETENAEGNGGAPFSAEAFGEATATVRAADIEIALLQAKRQREAAA